MPRAARLVLIGLCLGLAACTAEDPKTRASASLAQAVLLPAYAAWASADQQLQQSAAAFCAGQQDLSQARAAFGLAQSAWSSLQPLLVGPLAEGNRTWQVQFWPDKKNLVARQVEALLKNTPAPSQAQLEQASVVVQGLSAYEYVLFDPNIDLAAPAQKSRYCPLLQAIAGHQQALSGEILQHWQAEDGMAAQLSQFPNPRYADAGEAIGDLLRAQVSGLDGLKKKLGTPLGRQTKGQVQPYQAEGWRSDSSLASLAAALRGAQSLWLGDAQKGLRSLLDDSQQALAARLDSAYTDVLQQLDSLQQPLAELLRSEQGRQQLNELYERLDLLHRLHERELAKALGISLGFNAHDGD